MLGCQLVHLNAESEQFLENVISEEKKVTKATFFGKKLIVKLFNYKILAKIWAKDYSSSTGDF